MPTSFWRSAEVQEQLNRLDRSGFAAQFLARNPGFQEDCERTRQKVALGEIDIEMARSRLGDRWGLSFCLGPHAAD
jgi:hypothetical protein